MRSSRALAILLLPLCCTFAAGKNKNKVILPEEVLRAETVLVVIDPDAGVAPDAPLANQKARDAVENALVNWGRFRLANEVSTADLVITVRKGSGKIAQGTIGGVPINNRPVIFQPTDSGGRVGGSQGTPPMQGDPTDSQSGRPTPEVQVGSSQDTFAVYFGRRDNALDSPAVWRYVAKDALQSPGVPAIEEFKKAITAAEKLQAARP